MSAKSQSRRGDLWVDTVAVPRKLPIFRLRQVRPGPHWGVLPWRDDTVEVREGKQHPACSYLPWNLRKDVCRRAGADNTSEAEVGRFKSMAVSKARRLLEKEMVGIVLRAVGRIHGKVQRITLRIQVPLVRSRASVVRYMIVIRCSQASSRSRGSMVTAFSMCCSTSLAVCVSFC